MKYNVQVFNCIKFKATLCKMLLKI